MKSIQMRTNRSIEKKTLLDAFALELRPTHESLVFNKRISTWAIDFFRVPRGDKLAKPNRAILTILLSIEPLGDHVKVIFNSPDIFTSQSSHISIGRLTVRRSYFFPSQ